ncbi:MAG: type II toxin-antitoxin system prevent-host-death family antitoxin [Tepidisphaeraceae bacterium]
MTQLDVQEAAPKLADLVARARAGEEVVISQEGKPAVRLVPAEENPRERVFGMFKGKIWMSDDFQAPLTDEELKDCGL